MSAEATLNTALTGYAPLTALVGTRIDRLHYLPGSLASPADLPRIVFQRIGTTRQQAVTGAVQSRSVRFVVICLSDSSVEATTVAEKVEDALLSAIGSFHDVTLGNESAEWDPSARIYSQTVEAECLEA